MTSRDDKPPVPHFAQLVRSGDPMADIKYFRLEIYYDRLAHLPWPVSDPRNMTGKKKKGYRPESGTK